jgi:GNAT superfamily N-acetyltransferase
VHALRVSRGEVLARDAHTLDERELIGELDAELDEMYPEPGANHFELPTADVFLVAWQPQADGTERALGCGALRVIDAGVGELKRMYVRPEARGRRVGGMLLTALETSARGLGCGRLVLETGRRQNAAMALYVRHGFTPVPCWGEYLRSADTSACLGKDLHLAGEER